MDCLFVAETHGDDWLTGGAFGLDASVVTVAMSLVLSTLMIIGARRSKRQRQIG